MHKDDRYLPTIYAYGLDRIQFGTIHQAAHPTHVLMYYQQQISNSYRELCNNKYSTPQLLQLMFKLYATVGYSAYRIGWDLSVMNSESNAWNLLLPSTKMSSQAVTANYFALQLNTKQTSATTALGVHDNIILFPNEITIHQLGVALVNTLYQPYHKDTPPQHRFTIYIGTYDLYSLLDDERMNHIPHAKSAYVIDWLNQQITQDISARTIRLQKASPQTKTIYDYVAQAEGRDAHTIYHTPFSMWSDQLVEQTPIAFARITDTVATLAHAYMDRLPSYDMDAPTQPKHQYHQPSYPAHGMPTVKLQSQHSRSYQHGTTCTYVPSTSCYARPCIRCISH